MLPKCNSCSDADRQALASRYHPPGIRQSSDASPGSGGAGTVAGLSTEVTADMRQAIDPPNAIAVGPYSSAVQTGSTIFCSGQTPIDPETKSLVEGDVGDQTQQCFVNLFSVLGHAGLGPDEVVKVNVFLTNMADFEAMNLVYAQQFSKPYPARTTIGVAALPLGAAVEIELIAETR